MSGVEELLARLDDFVVAAERSAAAFERMALALETMAAVYREDVYASDAELEVGGADEPTPGQLAFEGP